MRFVDYTFKNTTSFLYKENLLYGLFYLLSLFPLLDYGISAVLLYSFLVVNLLVNGIKIDSSWFFIGFFIYLFGITLVYSSFYETYKELSHSISIITIPICASSFKINKEKVKIFTFLYIGCILLKSIICIFLLFDDWNFLGGGTIPFLSVDFHATYFSYEVIIALVLVDYFLEKRGRLVLLIFLSVVVVIFQKKIAFLTLVLFWVMHIKNSKHLLGLLLIPLCALIFYFKGGVFNKFHETVNKYLDFSLVGTDKVRLKLLEAGWSNFKEAPFFGKGAVEHKIFFSQYNLSNLGPWASDYDTHNYFLFIVCSGGLLALILFIFAFIYFLIKSYNLTKPFFHFLIITLIFNLTESVLIRYSGALTFSVFCFLFYKIYLSEAKKMSKL